MMNHTVRHLVRNMRSRDAHGTGRGAGLRTMRQMNRLLVLNCMREEGPLARVKIADRTGLSRTTVGSIIDSLLREGLAREGSLLDAAPAGGRRAILVHFNADAGNVLGVDIGRTHFTVVASNLAANIEARHSGPFDADLGPSTCLPQLVAELRAFVERNHLSWDRIVGIGVGIPGPMDAGLSRLISPPRMPGWHGTDIRQILRRELGVPVYLDNDANMGALGESRFGAGRGVYELAYIKVGTGIGGGLVFNGQIYRGSRGSAGELGHVTIDSDGRLCDCGNRGCLEVTAGAAAIVQNARTGGYRGGAGDSAKPGVREMDVAEVVSAALAGDAACRAAVRRAGEDIGVALAGLVNLVNPSLILIAGGVSHAGELLLGPIRQAITTRSLPAASSHTEVRVAELGDNAIALGAVATVIDAAFSGPSSAAGVIPEPVGTGPPVPQA
jgi:glucokinase-like ROK family protein